jgi:hypothetical protein
MRFSPDGAARISHKRAARRPCGLMKGSSATNFATVLIQLNAIEMARLGTIKDNFSASEPKEPQHALSPESDGEKIFRTKKASVKKYALTR